MSERKNIDRLFQEKFKDFEVLPADNVWEGIEAKLKEKKNDRKLLPIWFKFAGVAAVLLIGLLIFDGMPTGFQNDSDVIVNQQTSNPNSEVKINDAIVETDKYESERQRKLEYLEPVEKNGSATESKIATIHDNDASNQQTSAGTNNTLKNFGKNDTRSIPTIKSDSDTGIARTDVPQNKKEKNGTTEVTANPQSQVAASGRSGAESSNSSRISSDYLNEDSQVAQINTAKSTLDKTGNVDQSNKPENKIVNDAVNEKKLDSAAVATVEPNALEELLNEKENKSVVQNEPKLNRWQISTNVAPIYFSSTSNGSPIDSRLAQNSKEFNTDLAYGVGIRYSVNKKITLRTGINTVGMEQTTSDLVFTQKSNARTLAHVDPNIKGSLIQIESRIPNANLFTPELSDEGRKFSSSISQRTGYIEVPVEMSYKLIDKKLTVEVIGGFSTLFLNENSISLLTSGIEMEIGKATNLNDLHFSTNLGVGLRYSLFKSFQLNVEPMFKYQLNTYSNTDKINPYLFGLYTGISYRF